MSFKWSDPSKQEATTFKTHFIDHSRDIKVANVSIEGKEGKLTILIRFKEWAKTLKPEPDSYDELRN